MCRLGSSVFHSYGSVEIESWGYRMQQQTIYAVFIVIFAIISAYDINELISPPFHYVTSDEH